MRKLFKILAVLLALAVIVCTGVTAWNMHEKYTQEQAVVNDLKSQIARTGAPKRPNCRAQSPGSFGSSKETAEYCREGTFTGRTLKTRS